jgi:hypothetical protein
MLRARIGVILLLVAGCVSPGASGGSPHAAASSSPDFAGASPSNAATSPSPTQQPLPTLPPEAPSVPETQSLLLGAAVRVDVAELNVRELPSQDARRVGTVTPDNVIVVSNDPPIEADGYTWYNGTVVSANGTLPALGTDFRGDAELGGWFAAARGTTEYVRFVAPRCPDVIDLRTVSGMLPAETLACFGDRSLVLEGTVGWGEVSGYFVGEFSPGWLADPFNGALLTSDLRSETRGLIVLHFPPEGPAQPPDGSVIEVRGHFNDHRAERCEIAAWWDDRETFVPYDPAVAELLCRQRFVVDSHEITGTSPD